MKQNKLVRAYKSLNKLANQELPITIACKVHRLIVSIRPAWEFQVSEEEKILGRLKPEVLTGGDLQVKSVEEAQEFKTRAKEIGDIDVDDITIVPIAIPANIDAALTPNDIEALDGFIEFTE